MYSIYIYIYIYIYTIHVYIRLTVCAQLTQGYTLPTYFLSPCFGPISTLPLFVIRWSRDIHCLIVVKHTALPRIQITLEEKDEVFRFDYKVNNVFWKQLTR